MKGGDSHCPFRISSEGLRLILPSITKQILYSSAVELKHLLEKRSVRFGDFLDREFGERAAKLMPGGCILMLLSKGIHS